MSKCFALVVAALLAAQLHAAVQEARPNILFIFSDDQRHDLLGVQNPEIHTPNLDSLAESGVLFDRAFATTAICSPARAAVLTGRYGSRNGVTGLGAAIHATETTFAELLRQQGYRTAHFGKWHIKNPPASVGFDDYAAIYANGSWFQRKLKFCNIADVPGALNGEFYEKFMADHITTYISNRVATAESPFCIWWCNQVPHVDNKLEYPASQAALSRYRAADMPVPESWSDDLDGKPPHLKDSDFFNKSAKQNYGGPGGYLNMDPGERNPYRGQDHVQEHNREFYATVTDLDEQIGRVLAALEDPNGDGSTTDSIAGNTWVVFTADNGWQTGSHKFTSKVLSYEESIRVPLIVRAPHIAPRTETNLVLNIDIPQMLLAAAGASIPANMQGLNLRRLLEHPDTPWRESIYHESISKDLTNQPHHALRTARHKYIVTPGTPAPFEELYDLKADPHELTNLANDPQHAPLKSTLARKLELEKARIKNTP